MDFNRLTRDLETQDATIRLCAKALRKRAEWKKERSRQAHIDGNTEACDVYWDEAVALKGAAEWLESDQGRGMVLDLSTQEITVGDPKKIDVSRVTPQELKDAIRAVRPGEPLTVLRDGVARMQIVIPGRADPEIREGAIDETIEHAYRLGTIVGAAIVAWGDAMREREEAKRRAKDWEDRMLEEDMGG